MTVCSELDLTVEPCKPFYDNILQKCGVNLSDTNETSNISVTNEKADATTSNIPKEQQ